jgi:hypothetical protein
MKIMNRKVESNQRFAVEEGKKNCGIPCGGVG